MILNQVSDTKCIMPLNTNVKNNKKLFCFPYAGGGASYYKKWTEFLPRDCSLYGLQLPGRENRIAETPYNDISSLVKDLSEEIISVLDDAPFAFFGHSMGGLLAFEVSHFLQDKGYIPEHLIVSGKSAPHIENNDPPLHLLDDENLIEKLRVINGVRPEVLENKELMTLFLSMLREDFKIVENYKFNKGKRLKCPIFVVGGAQDPKVDPERLHEWSKHTSGGFNSKVFPGDHFFINNYIRETILLTERALYRS